MHEIIRRGRAYRLRAFFLLLSLVAAGAAAEEPRFFIESVRFGQEEHSSDAILLAESGLEAGREYEERQLASSASRLRQLPFVVDVELALEKGSERGRYVLVVTAVLSERWFFGNDARAIFEHQTSVGANLVREAFGLEDDRERFDEDEGFATAGWRSFVGTRGVFHAAIDSKGLVYSSLDGFKVHDYLQLGYTQYGLFGTPAFASVDVAQGVSENRRRYGLELGVPFGGRQSVRFEFRKFDFEDDDSYETKTGWQRFGLEWRFDGRDDPVFSASGWLLSARLRHVKDELTSRIFAESTSSEPERDWQKEWLVRFEGERFVSLSKVTTLRFGAAFEASTADILGSNWRNGERELIRYRRDVFSLKAEIGGSRVLLTPSDPATWNDLRFDASASFLAGLNRFDSYSNSDVILSRWELQNGLVFRNRWGLFRFSVLYRNDSRRER